VLDFGCGSGIYANLLTKKGAKISGFDISSEMIKIAKQKNPLLDLRVGSGYNIPFQQKFDIVFASLAIGYMSNWNLVFKQVGKVLNKNGLFVFSTDNPIIACKSRIKVDNKDIIYLGEKDYFQINAKHNSWQMPTGTFQVPWNHKTYEYIIKTIVNSGFELVDYTDAKPLKSAKKYFPEYYEEYSKIPRFSIWKVRKK
jgi:SAM-dependent methyltransferase